jgi:hypothetical protein
MDRSTSQEASQDYSAFTTLNEAQARRLRVSCQYIERMLLDVERFLDEPRPDALFKRYAADVAPETRVELAGTIASIRAAIVRGLDLVPAQGEELIPASRAIHVAIGTAGITAEELKPSYMRGYGELAEPQASALACLSSELCRLLAKADAPFAHLDAPPDDWHAPQSGTEKRVRPSGTTS